jgi:hypothetical protein
MATSGRCLQDVAEQLQGIALVAELPGKTRFPQPAAGYAESIRQLGVVRIAQRAEFS